MTEFETVSEVPKFTTFRKAVNAIADEQESRLIKTAYLCSARIDELCTVVNAYDMAHNKTKPYGKLVTWKLDEFLNGEVKERALLLRLGVLKRRDKVRRKGEDIRRVVFKIVALPVNPLYEPWTLDVLKHIKETKNACFDMNRAQAYYIVRKHLSWLDSKISTKSLRHYRVTHLVTEYNFDPYEIVACTGWTLKSMMGGMGMDTGQMDVYAHLAWHKYFPKLLKPLPK